MDPYKAFKRFRPIHLIVILCLVASLIMEISNHVLSENFVYLLQEIPTISLWQIWQTIEQIWQAIGWAGCSAIAALLSAIAALFVAFDIWLKRREPPTNPPQTQQLLQIEPPKVAHSKKSNEKQVS